MKRVDASDLWIDRSRVGSVDAFAEPLDFAARNSHGELRDLSEAIRRAHVYSAAGPSGDACAQRYGEPV